MEHSTTILSTKYIDVVCKRVNGVWRYRKEYLESCNHRPAVLINERFYNFIDVTKPEFHAEHQHLMGGSGSGKSRFLITKFLLSSQKDQFFRLYYGRKHYNAIELSTYQDFKDTISYYGWDHIFRCLDSKMRIICLKTGNMMAPFGLDNLGSLRSIASPTDIWIEEGVSDKNIECVKRKEYGELNRRLRVPGIETHLHSSYNPINLTSFYYHDFFKEQKYNSVAIQHSTADDNAFLDDSYLAKLEESKGIDEDEYTIFRLGQWTDGNRGNKWIRTFKKAFHVGNVPFVVGLPIHLTYDFNVKPHMTLLCIQMIELYKKNRKGEMRNIIQVRVFKEYCLKNPQNTSEAVTQEFRKDYIDGRPAKHNQPAKKGYGYHTCYYYGDASGKSQIPGFGVLTAFTPIKNVLAELAQHNLADKTLKSNPLLIDARELVEDCFAGKYDIEIVIDEKCTETIDDITQLEESVTGFNKEKDPKQGNIENRGHEYQALSYFICSAFRNLMKQRGKKQSNQEKNDVQ